jgi:hypothetical protein
VADLVLPAEVSYENVTMDDVDNDGHDNSSLSFLYEYCTVSRQILGCRVFVYLEVCVRGSPAKVDSTMSFLSNGGRITRFYLILPQADSTNFNVDENGP